MAPGLAGCGYESLMEAAKAGNLGAVRAFVARDKAAMNQIDSNGLTPMTWAILNGNNAVAVYLLDEGFPVNAWPEHALSPLIACTSRYTRESTEMLRILLERGANPNQRYDKEGWLPLSMAVNNYMPDKVRLLVQYGADFSSRDQSGMTPLELAEARLANMRNPDFHWPHGELEDPKFRAEQIKRWEEMVVLVKELMKK
jgi:ankyrin repeat protein